MPLLNSVSRLTRRETLKRASAAAMGIAVGSVFGSKTKTATASDTNRGDLQRVTLGLVADVHQDIIHDGWARMRVFIDDMQKRKVDALLQLGDFALPHSRNQPFLDTWNEYKGPKYHVLGNHDTDSGFTKAQTMKWWGMEEKFYSFDLGGWHVVVLDGNDKNPGEWIGYVRYINQAQRDWLAADLAATDAPTIVFSHQKLESDDGIANSGEVRAILEAANKQAGRKKVFACLCGHHHSDGVTEIEGIRYVHINSMSYKWVGGAHQRKRFADHIEQAFPTVSRTAPYRDPLYTVLTLDPEEGTMTIEGRKTSFIPPTPAEMKLEHAAKMLPVISDLKVKVL
jgi:predicted phosphodiesterase